MKLKKTPVMSGSFKFVLLIEHYLKIASVPSVGQIKDYFIFWGLRAPTFGNCISFLRLSIPVPLRPCGILTLQSIYTTTKSNYYANKRKWKLQKYHMSPLIDRSCGRGSWHWGKLRVSPFKDQFICKTSIQWSQAPRGVKYDTDLSEAKGGERHDSILTEQCYRQTLGLHDVHLERRRKRIQY